MYAHQAQAVKSRAHHRNVLDGAVQLPPGGLAAGAHVTGAQHDELADHPADGHDHRKQQHDGGDGKNVDAPLPAACHHIGEDGVCVHHAAGQRGGTGDEHREKAQPAQQMDEFFLRGAFIPRGGGLGVLAHHRRVDPVPVGGVGAGGAAARRGLRRVVLLRFAPVQAGKDQQHGQHDHAVPGGGHHHAGPVAGQHRAGHGAQHPQLAVLPGVDIIILPGDALVSGVIVLQSGGLDARLGGGGVDETLRHGIAEVPGAAVNQEGTAAAAKIRAGGGSGQGGLTVQLVDLAGGHRQPHHAHGIPAAGGNVEKLRVKPEFIHIRIGGDVLPVAGQNIAAQVGGGSRNAAQRIPHIAAAAGHADGGAVIDFDGIAVQQFSAAFQVFLLQHGGLQCDGIRQLVNMLKTDVHHIVVKVILFPLVGLDFLLQAVQTQRGADVLLGQGEQGLGKNCHGAEQHGAAQRHDTQPGQQGNVDGQGAEQPDPVVPHGADVPVGEQQNGIEQHTQRHHGEQDERQLDGPENGHGQPVDAGGAHQQDAVLHLAGDAVILFVANHGEWAGIVQQLVVGPANRSGLLVIEPHQIAAVGVQRQQGGVLRQRNAADDGMQIDLAFLHMRGHPAVMAQHRAEAAGRRIIHPAFCGKDVVLTAQPVQLLPGQSLRQRVAPQDAACPVQQPDLLRVKKRGDRVPVRQGVRCVVGVQQHAQHGAAFLPAFVGKIDLPRILHRRLGVPVGGGIQRRGALLGQLAVQQLDLVEQKLGKKYCHAQDHGQYHDDDPQAQPQSLVRFAGLDWPRGAQRGLFALRSGVEEHGTTSYLFVVSQYTMFCPAGKEKVERKRAQLS